MIIVQYMMMENSVFKWWVFAGNSERKNWIII